MTGSCSETFDRSVYNLPSSSLPCAVSISNGRGFMKSTAPSCLPPEKGSLERSCSPAMPGIGHNTCSNPARTAPAHITPRPAKSLRVSIILISQPVRSRSLVLSASTLLRLTNCEHLIGSHVLENFVGTAGPKQFKLLHQRSSAEAKMNAHVGTAG